MKDNATRWFDDCVERLADPQHQRVWSVIVSLFGDLARQPGNRLSGSALGRIIGPIGIRPEAIRVAVHRLRKDGWLESQRSGRESQHFLSAFGREQSAAVSPRIYTRTPDATMDWHIVIADEASGVQVLDDLLLTESHVSIGRNVAIGVGPAPTDSDDLLVFSTTPVTVPGWFRDKVCPPDLNSACRQLAADLAEVDKLLAADLSPTPLQTATLRTLIVHRWRRVALRYPDLPAAFFPADWPGETCRERVFALLDRLPRPSLTAIEDDCTG
jgi:phenylacetic acid degradation operon negative regulatory protein